MVSSAEKSRPPNRVFPVLPLPRCWSLLPGRGPGKRFLRLHPSAMTDLAVRTAIRDSGFRAKTDPAVNEHTAFCGTGDSPAPPLQDEGYALAIGPHHIVVSGRDRRGLVWGLGTLAQLVDAGLPCCTIEDWPAFPVRYHHDDVSRKQVSTLADFRRIIGWLARFKFSHYTLYLEDMLVLDGVPQMGEGRGGLTPDDIRAIVAEGEALQVEVFPTISLAGHQENLLKLPRYRPLGARTWQPPSSFDSANPLVREHLAKVIDAVCPLFPSRFFHMGFDELQGFDAEGFVAHANWCAARLVEKGKTPLIWADMLYNHFGCDLLGRLHPEIVPVAWDYDAAPGPGRKAFRDLLKYRPHAWALAGYNNWGSFVHAPSDEIQEQWNGWLAELGASGPAGFGASQWGDDGYENHRDFCWHLFAAFAEKAWSGSDGDAATVESRFQEIFYGHAVPELSRLRRLLESGLSFDGSKAWKLHRLPAAGWVREARAGNLPSLRTIASDLRKIAGGRKLLDSCRMRAVRSRGHLDHYGVALDRMESVALRMCAALRNTEADRAAAVLSLKNSRASYRRAWLANNRPENIEVSLAVFDAQIESWRQLGARTLSVPKKFHPLDLSRAWNACLPGIAGIPLGLSVIDGVPLKFADAGHTNIDLAPGKTLCLPLPSIPLADIHLVASCARDNDEPRPVLLVRLTAKGRLLYEEELLSIRHLCDWWAPLGEHMWSGGGFRYVDPLRVRYVMCPNPPYGLTAVHRFPWPGAPQPDRMELVAIGSRSVQIFAVTLVEARR